FIDPLYNMAKLHRQGNRLDRAVEAYEKLLALRPGHVDGLINLGNIYFESGLPEDAIPLYERALAADPSTAVAARVQLNIGNAYRRMGDDTAAMAAFERSLNIAPLDGLRIKQALTLPVVLESWDHIHQVREQFEGRVSKLLEMDLMIEDPALETSTTTFFLAYHGLSDRKLQEMVAALHLKACPELAMTAPHCHDPRPPGGKIKLGLVSAYFRVHSIGRLMRGIVEHLDRDEFEVTVFTHPGQSDEIASFIEAKADRCVRLPVGLDDAREAIAATAQDVLFYADIGMDIRTYFLAFARLAPVQCVTWGHPDTTGLPNIDYFLSSKLMEREGAEVDYSEELYLLNTLPTVYREPEHPGPLKTRDQFGLPADKTIYFCPQSTIKHHPDTDDFVAAVLRGDENGKVYFLEGAVSLWSKKVADRMARTIPDVVDRIHTIPRVSPEDFLSLMSVCDVIFDTPHFSGGNTSYEAFAMRAPIVTHAGDFMRGRVTTAQYKMMDIGDLIAEEVSDMANIALKLGKDSDYRFEMANQIAARREVLFGELEAVRELERFFSQAAAKIG
ncbi:MAG: tetratricopeptide repeat protein, partial [Proteobacteria bacterium]|nr:tetratricopeptide repeat protein [Pseudomonadota bacterium]